METKKINGRTLTFIGMIVYLLIAVTDRFIFEVPAPIHITILLIVIVLLFRGLWLRKRERDKER